MVGRVEVLDGLVVVSNRRRIGLLLVIVPGFDLENGEAISFTEQPHAYVQQVAEDLDGATGLRTTPLHEDASCEGPR